MAESERLERVVTGYGLLNGPLWDEERGSLLFADASNGGAFELMAGGQINCVVPHRRGIGGLAPHARGGLVIGGRNIAWRSGDRSCVLAKLDPTLGMTRFNDLGTDRRGRLFAGSLEFNPGKPHAGRPGFLHVVELDGHSRVVDENILQANGIAASPRGDRLYVADTLARAIWSYELRSDGELGKRTPLIEWSLGEPDGIATSCDGALWIALREEWCIAVIEPDGRERRRIPAPPGKLTALCFGGPDYRTLFVTTGTFSDSKGGSIYRCQVEETGEPVTPLPRSDYASRPRLTRSMKGTNMVDKHAPPDLAALWEIGQLPIRYALAIDSRNVELMASLFSERSEAGRWGHGRTGLHNFYKTNWKKFRRSVHTVSNHSIELVDAHTARGTVYCHAEQEAPTTGMWSQLQMAYEDDYVKEDGSWLFLLRKICFWYRDVDGVRQYGGGKNPSLPDLWPTWAAYWNEPAKPGAP